MTLDDLFPVRVGDKFYVGTSIDSICTIRWLHNKLDNRWYCKDIHAVNVLWICKIVIAAYDRGDDWKKLLVHFYKYGSFLSHVLMDYQPEFAVLTKNMQDRRSKT